MNFKGFNYVSYYNGGYANADSMPAMVSTGANAVALAFEYGINVQNSTVYADQNYTEQSSVIAATIAEAKSRGLTVMVRPLIDFLDQSKIGSYSVGDWRSTYNPTNVATFFASYKTMIVSVAQLAQTNGAAGLSIGVELDQLTGPAYQSYWADIITSVRAVFSGKLTYSSEWDDDISPWAGQHGLAAGTGDLSTQVSFWSQLDYLGIDAYPPISDASNPTVAQLIAGWTQTPTDSSSLATTGNQSLISYFSGVATKVGLPLVFTEIGYESATDAASQPFGTSTNVYDPTLQANLYTAFFEAWQQDGNNALTGVYFWNWDPNVAEVGPGNGPNFSPQGEPAQTVVTANFTATAPALQVSPTTNVASSGDEGGPFSPSSFQYQLQATSGSVGYAISGVPGWLTASSTSGTVTTSATTITFSINTSANALSPAIYNATITFTDTTNNVTVQTTSATLTVDAMYTLSVGASGSGTVTSSPSGISCGSTCSANFASGQQVTLTATPASGYYLSGWSGACSGTGSCTVTMSAAESVTATFSQLGMLALTVNISGNGTVASSPTGISCPGLCTADFAGGTPVMLTASPTGGATFNGWGGACTGAGSCQVTMNSIESVTAQFSSSSGGSPGSRTWVSAALGNDSNSCTRDTPCLTFAAALAQTSAGGEIDCLDPGDFGALTITTSIAIVCGTAGEAGALVSSTNGVTIAASSTSVIHLEGLDFEGLNSSPSGIQVNTAGEVHIVNCRVRGFNTAGINVSNSSAPVDIDVTDTIVADNAGEGILIKPTGGFGARAMINRTRVLNNGGDGIMSNATLTTAPSGLKVLIRDSESAHNSEDGYVAYSSGTDDEVMIAASTSIGNNRGINSSGAGAIVRFTYSTITANQIGVNQVGAGVATSYMTNSIAGNTANGTFAAISKE